jgi:hypothetical protein
MNHRWISWIAALLLWSILGVLFALPGISSSNGSHALLSSLAQWWSWGLITPLIFWTDAQLPFKEKQLGMRVLAHLLASVALTIPYFYLFVAMRALLGLGAWSVLADTRFSCDRIPQRPSMELARLLGHLWRAADLPVLTNTILRVNCGWSAWSAAFHKPT